MHYYEGPLPTPNTREHWLFYRPYGKCVFSDGWVVLFNRGYQAIFERRPGRMPAVIAGRVSDKPHGAEQTTFFYDDGTDLHTANQRIDTELTALELAPLPPMPRLSTDEALDRMRSALRGKEEHSRVGSGRLAGSDAACAGRQTKSQNRPLVADYQGTWHQIGLTLITLSSGEI